MEQPAQSPVSTDSRSSMGDASDGDRTAEDARDESAGSESRSVSIVVPTFNEAGNVEHVIERCRGAMDGTDYEVLVVDDDSPDSTRPASATGREPSTVTTRPNSDYATSDIWSDTRDRGESRPSGRRASGGNGRWLTNPATDTPSSTNARRWRLSPASASSGRSSRSSPTRPVSRTSPRSVSGASAASSPWTCAPDGLATPTGRPNRPGRGGGSRPPTWRSGPSSRRSSSPSRQASADGSFPRSVWSADWRGSAVSTYVVRPAAFRRYQATHGRVASQYVLVDSGLTARATDWSVPVREAFGDRLDTDYGLARCQDGVAVYRRGYDGDVRGITRERPGRC